MYGTYKSIKTYMQENSRRISYITYGAAVDGVQDALSEIHNIARYVA